MSVTFDLMGSEAVARRIGELSGEFGVSIRFICMEQMKLFARDVIKQTGGDGKMSIGQQRKRGKAAVASDLNKIFEDDSDTVSDIAMNISGRHLIKTATGATYVVPPEHYAKSMSVSEMKSIHKSRRNRKGRTNELQPGKLGGFTTLNKYYVEKRTYKKYVQQVQSRVGLAKAGWVIALQRLEAKTGGKPVSGIPQFVRKMAVFAKQSGLIDNRAGDDVMLKASNQLSYAHLAMPQHVINGIGQKRQRDLFGSMAKRMDQVVERFNKTK